MRLLGVGVVSPLLAPLFSRLTGWARPLPAYRRLTVTSDLGSALAGAHAVMPLRLQQERMEAGLLPSLREYAARYGITAERIRSARPGDCSPRKQSMERRLSRMARQ